VHSSLSSLSSLLLSVRLSLAGPSRSDTRSRLALTTALTLTFVDCARGTHNCRFDVTWTGCRYRFTLLTWLLTDCRITYLSFEDVDPVTRSLSGYSGCSQRGVVVVPVLSTSSRDSISLLGVTVSYRAATHAAGAGCLALS